MGKTFSYRVCQTEMARVSFVNGRWQGLQVAEHSNPTELYNSCPMVWEYLESAGRDGWELVAVASQGDGSSGSSPSSTLLFLKKELLPNPDAE